MARRKCKKCGSKNVAKILYGYMQITPDLQKELDEKKTILGGCCVLGGGLDPRWECNDCEYYWPTPWKESDSI